MTLYTSADLAVSTTLDGQAVVIGEHRISLGDFLGVAFYVLTNTDLVAGDERPAFVDTVTSMTETAGYNPGGRRLVPGNPGPR